MIDKSKVQNAIKLHAALDEVTLLEVLKDHVIQDEAQQAEAGEFVKQVKAAFRLVDDTRASFTAPLREAEKWVNDQFRPVLNRLTETEATLKKMLGAFAAKQQAAQRALAVKAAELAPKAVTKEAYVEALAQVQQAAPVKVQGVSTRTVWKFRVVNADDVERGYCSPDEVKIRAAVAAGARGNDIPGVRIYEDQVVTVRS